MGTDCSEFVPCVRGQHSDAKILAQIKAEITFYVVKVGHQPRTIKRNPKVHPSSQTFFGHGAGQGRILVSVERIIDLNGLDDEYYRFRSTGTWVRVLERGSR